MFSITLWIVQILLGAAFIMAGVMKSFTPIPQLALRMPWAAELPEALVRFIGISELAGGIGVLLPSLLRVKPQLTPLAAVGLGTIMFLAAAFNFSRGDMAHIGMDAMLGLLAAFVAWGRWKKAPILSRAI